MTLWEILKANKTGIAPDMFTMLAANKMNGGRDRLHELTGTPPLSFTAKGKPLSAWSITGSIVQDGTPTPENPVDVQGVGDYDSETGMYRIPVVTKSDGAEPITTPIYLPTPLYRGEVLRSDGSRDVKRGKLVLTGEETWKLQSVNDYGIYNFYTEFTIPMNVISGLCNNFKPQNSLISDTKDVGFLLSKQATSTTLYIRADNRIATDVNAFKSWLAAKYAAGTPVTVWYRLAAPTTETFTAPQIPTLNGTTVIDVDTAVKPESMTIKYRR